MKNYFFKNYQNLKQNCNYEFLKLVIKILNIKKSYDFLTIKLKYQNFCYITGVKRSILNFFLISRWDIKQKMINYNGLKKLSW